MGEKGRCHCGDISYEIADEAAPLRHSMCHCSDCRKANGVPAVSWSLFPRNAVTICGAPSVYNSSPGTSRSFCGKCGTGLFFENDVIFPGQIDIQSATLDNQSAYPLEEQVQTAERLGYMKHLDSIPSVDRYPENQ